MDYSNEVLEATPERVTKFLMGIGAVAAIRTLMAEAGMTDDDIVEGRTLLLDVLAAPRKSGATPDTADARAQRAATTELDQWDEPNFGRYGAALRRRFPDVRAYVFKGLSASTGTAAVQGVATFLTRLDALESGADPDRAATKQSDKKAVAFLGTRGLDRAERKRLQGLVDIALGPTSPLPEQTELPETARRREALVKLRGWFDEWSTTARAVISMRRRTNFRRISRPDPCRKLPARVGRLRSRDGGLRARDGSLRAGDGDLRVRAGTPQAPHRGPRARDGEPPPAHRAPRARRASPAEAQSNHRHPTPAGATRCRGRTTGSACPSRRSLRPLACAGS